MTYPAASKASIMTGIKRQRGLVCIKIGPFAGQKQPWEQHSEVNTCRKGASLAEFQQKDNGNPLIGPHVLKDVTTQAQTADEEKWSELKECRRSSSQGLHCGSLFFFPSILESPKNFEDRKFFEFFWSGHVKTDVWWELEGWRYPAVPHLFHWVRTSILK